MGCSACQSQAAQENELPHLHSLILARCPNLPNNFATGYDSQGCSACQSQAAQENELPHLHSLIWQDALICQTTLQLGVRFSIGC
ncbi:uncharacterized protein [Hetaerina americana]|uniref:uncharacterized protein isoform X2 n=1 Tax=Hetaerina americana TaxID=62018 RepID=UPI003A7F3897